MRKIFPCCLLLVSIFSLAWFSVWWDTHWYLMDDVLKADAEKFSKEEYPDIWRFWKDIREGAAG